MCVMIIRRIRYSSARDLTSVHGGLSESEKVALRVDDAARGEGRELCGTRAWPWVVLRCIRLQEF